jgi:hypothetical protein
VGFIFALCEQLFDLPLTEIDPDWSLQELENYVCALPQEARTLPEPLHHSSQDVYVTANRYAYLSALRPRHNHWRFMSRVFELERPMQAHHLHVASRALLARHDGLRLRIYERDNTWHQTITDDTSALQVYEQDISSNDYVEEFNRLVGDRFSTITLGDRPFAILALGKEGVSPFHVVFLTHHALIDGVSVRIIERDFFEFYDASLASRTPPEPRFSVSYRDYCEAYRAHFSNLESRALEFWRAQPWSSINSPPGSAAGPPQRYTHEHALTFEHGDRLIQSIGKNALSVALLSSLARAYGVWTGEAWFCLGLAHHSRSPLHGSVDAGGVVGWLLDITPLIIPTDGASAHQATRRMLAQSDTMGRAFSFLRHRQPGAASAGIDEWRAPQMVLNMGLGPHHALPSFVRTVQRARMRRTPALLDAVYPMAGGVVLSEKDGTLRLSWDFNSQHTAPGEITILLRQWEEELRAVLREEASGHIELPLAQFTEAAYEYE